MNFKTTDKMLLRTTSIYAEQETSNKKAPTLNRYNHSSHFNRMEELHHRKRKKKGKKKKKPNKKN